MINLVKLFQKNDEIYILLVKLVGFLTIFGSSYLAFYLRDHTHFYDFLTFFHIETNQLEGDFLSSIYFKATLTHLATYLLVLLFSKIQYQIFITFF